MSRPLISIVVIAYDMTRQAMNTLYSLSRAHQKNAAHIDYEVLMIENKSARNMSPDEIDRLEGQFRYYLLDDDTESPAKAINYGLQNALGQHIGLMIDGARMVSPRIIEYVSMAIAASSNYLVAIPGYNLGSQQHHLNIQSDYGEPEEIALLNQSCWKDNGYRLFDIASIGDANANGFISPLLESNCFFSSANNFTRIGGANEDFNLPGGGSLNLHMFRQLGTLPDIQYFLLPGEGTFHQFHGGITTREDAEREAVLESHRKQLHSYWGGEFHSLRKEPVLLGSITSHAMRYLKYSSRKTTVRGKRRTNSNLPLWPDDGTEIHL